MLVNMEEQFDKAQAIVMDQKASMTQLSEAFDIFTAFQNMEPRNPQVLFGMATVAARRKQYALAVLLYEIFLRIEKEPYKQAAAHLNIGKIYHDDGKKDVSLGYFNKAIELCKDSTDPDGMETYKLARINLAGNAVSTGNPDEALQVVNEVLDAYPDCEEAFHIKCNKGMNLLEKGIYGEGWDFYHEHTPRHSVRDYSGEGSPPTWDGTKGKTVLIYGEQGIGDEIMFASMIPDLMKDCNVVMDAHLRLAEMFRESFKIPVYATREFNCIRWKHYEKIDYKLPIGSLGKWYRRELKDFPKAPYLKANKRFTERFKRRLEELGDYPCIGLSWRGGTKSTNKQHRNLDLEQLKPVLNSIKANWISLQYQPSAEMSINAFNEKSDAKIHHWKNAIEDYDFTAALVSSLDLVISVPQSVVHLAGALGTPTWQMTPKAAMWQMGPYGEDMPWYECVKNYWQPDFGDWDSVIKNVTEGLQIWNSSRMNIAA